MATPVNVSSRTQMANLALQRIGVKTISDIASGTDLVSTTANRFFMDTRDSLARMLPWTALMGRTTLAANTAIAAGDFAYQETLASTVLRVLEIVPSTEGAENVDYRIEGTRMYHNISAGWFRRISQPSTITAWDPLFLEAFECRLAQKMALPLTGSLMMAQLMQQEFTTAISIAIQVKAVETMDSNDQILLALQRENDALIAALNRRVKE